MFVVYTLVDSWVCLIVCCCSFFGYYNPGQVMVNDFMLFHTNFQSHLCSGCFDKLGL